MDTAPGQPRSLHELASEFTGFYSTLVLLAAAVSLGMTIWLLLRGRGPALSAALMLVIPLPLFVAAIAATHGMMESYDVIAKSSARPDPIEVRKGINMFLVVSISAVRWMVLIGFIALVGCVRRSFKDTADSQRPSTATGETIA